MKTKKQVLSSLLFHEIDENRFTYLYNLYHREIYANICRILGDNTDAEDIQQEVFTLLWNRRLRLHRQQSISGWLYLTSYYKSLEYLRKQRGNKVVNMDVSSVPRVLGMQEKSTEEPSVAQLQRLLLKEAIRHLSQRKRMAFFLCKMKGYSYEETAAVMGITKASVKDYLKMAMRFIHQYIQIQLQSRRDCRVKEVSEDK